MFQLGTGHVALYEINDKPVVFYVKLRGSQGAPRYPRLWEFQKPVLEGLCQSGRVFSLQGEPCYSHEGVYRTMSKRNPSSDEPGLLAALPVCSLPTDKEDVNEAFEVWWDKGWSAAQAALPTLFDRLEAKGADPHYPRGLLANISEWADLLPKAHGSLRVPTLGPAENTWLSPSLPPTHSTDYSTLRALFSAFDLTPPNHCTLYSYLLCTLHSTSLDYPRPILLVDGERSRGKSEVQQAISWVVDDDNRGVALPRGRASREVITAFLISGRRVLSSHNVDGVKDYNDDYLVALATDGSIGDRVKYGRETSHFPHVLVTLSTVTGAASFHPDLLSRVWRVELLGGPAALDPAPAAYAKHHRGALRNDIYRALSESTPIHVPSRVSNFAATALGAYARAFGLTASEVLARFTAASRGKWALTSPALLDLHKHRNLEVSEKIRLHSAPSDDSIEIGASARGVTWDGKQWL